MYKLFSRRFWRFRGFTQIEVLIIVFIIGIVATMATPSFADMLESIKIKQAVTELRSAFQESQRQSIRNGQPCSTNLLIPLEYSNSVQVQGECLQSGDRTLPTGIGLTTNVIADDSSASESATNPLRNPPIRLAGSVNSVTCALKGKKCSSEEGHTHAADKLKVKVGVGFSPSGAARFNIASADASGAAADASAKFVAYRNQKINAKKQCVVLSGSLGLTRIGRYEGGLTPEEITDQGRCTAVHWTQQ